MTLHVTCKGGQIGPFRWSNTISFTVLPAGEFAFIPTPYPITIWGAVQWN